VTCLAHNTEILTGGALRPKITEGGDGSVPACTVLDLPREDGVQ